MIDMDMRKNNIIYAYQTEIISFDEAMSLLHSLGSDERARILLEHSVDMKEIKEIKEMMR